MNTNDRFDKKFCKYAKSNAPKWIFGRPLKDGIDSNELKSFIAEEKDLLIDEILGEVKEIKSRFRCAACDGARCEHTLGCQSISKTVGLLLKKRTKDKPSPKEKE